MHQSISAGLQWQWEATSQYADHIFISGPGDNLKSYHTQSVLIFFIADTKADAMYSAPVQYSALYLVTRGGDTCRMEIWMK